MNSAGLDCTALAPQYPVCSILFRACLSTTRISECLFYWHSIISPLVYVVLSCLIAVERFDSLDSNRIRFFDFLFILAGIVSESLAQLFAAKLLLVQITRRLHALHLLVYALSPLSDFLSSRCLECLSAPSACTMHRTQSIWHHCSSQH